MEFPHQFSFDNQGLIISCQTAVYIFRQEVGKWVYRQKINRQDIPDTIINPHNLKTSEISQYFASQVIHRGNTLLICPQRLSSFSSLRIFERDLQDQRWKFKQVLEGNIDFSFQRFAFDGQTIFMGDPGSPPDGLIQTYQRNSSGSWKPTQKIFPGRIDRLGAIVYDNSSLFDHYAFGGGVAVKDNYMIGQCRVEGGTLKRASGEILLFKRKPRSGKWKPIARFGTGQKGQGNGPTLWPTFTSVYVSNNFAAIVNTGQLLNVNQEIKHFHIINLYKLQ